MKPGNLRYIYVSAKVPNLMQGKTSLNDKSERCL